MVSLQSCTTVPGTQKQKLFKGHLEINQKSLKVSLKNQLIFMSSYERFLCFSDLVYWFGCLLQVPGSSSDNMVLVLVLARYW